MTEINRLVLMVNKARLTDVFGPLEDKALCRSMLRDATRVLRDAPVHAFQPHVHGDGHTLSSRLIIQGVLMLEHHYLTETFVR